LPLESLPTYSVKELNDAVASLLLRGFAPLFLLKGTVSKCRLKRGHLWMTLTDGKASIDIVAWASQVSKINFRPKQEDGVLVVGKLNFWTAQARLSINAIDIRPSISTVLRKFEVVRDLLMKDGLIDEQRRRSLPKYPDSIAILTSVPSSALADMLRTAQERWPLTKLFVFPIPVQGEAVKQLNTIIRRLSSSYKELGIHAVVIARGGGSREDLMIFDNEEICREIANFPIPIITGIGHEDDLTVADLVADHRAATPTAAIVDLLPSREIALLECIQKKGRLSDYFSWFIGRETKNLSDRKNCLESNSPLNLIEKYKKELMYKEQVLNACSPQNWLRRGFCIARNKDGDLIKSVKQLKEKNHFNIQLHDGNIDSTINKINNELSKFE